MRLIKNAPANGKESLFFIENTDWIWCPGPESNRHGVLAPRDFKSLASTCFATWAFSWRLRPESNRRPRLCRPLHNHSATQPSVTQLRSQKLNSHASFAILSIVHQEKKSDCSSLNLERETRLELATPTLARLCSTTELFPRLYGLGFYRK